MGSGHGTGSGVDVALRRFARAFSVTEQRIVATAAVLLAVFGLALLPPEVPERFDLDHTAHAAAIEQMRAGAPYHDAMHEAMVVRDGGPSGAVRSFRLPTVFQLWVGLPDHYGSYVVLLAVVGAALVWLLPRGPLIVLPIVLYLIVMAYPRLEAGWVGFWLTVELWAVLPALVAVGAWWRRGDHAAAFAALLAASMREHLVLLLFGGLLAAWRQGRVRWPWMVAIGCFAALYTWHTAQALPFIADVGWEAPLFGYGTPGNVARMAGHGLPAGPVTGLLLMGTALWRSRSDPLPVPLLLLPLSGLIVGRLYWGAMIVPVALLALVGNGPTGPDRADASL
jgi:hypothetical protein